MVNLRYLDARAQERRNLRNAIVSTALGMLGLIGTFIYAFNFT